MVELVEQGYGFFLLVPVKCGEISECVHFSGQRLDWIFVDRSFKFVKVFHHFLQGFLEGVQKLLRAIHARLLCFSIKKRDRKTQSHFLSPYFKGLTFECQKMSSTKWFSWESIECRSSVYRAPYCEAVWQDFLRSLFEGDRKVCGPYIYFCGFRDFIHFLRFPTLRCFTTSDVFWLYLIVIFKFLYFLPCFYIIFFFKFRLLPGKFYRTFWYW